MNPRPILLVTLLALTGGCPAQSTPPEPASPPREWVWLGPLGPRQLPATPPAASPDTRRIYVSSSLGDDANAGLSVESPVRTIEKGKSLLRDQHPDWLLLRRGDRWDEPLGRWKTRGRTAREPSLVGAYGEGARPLLRTGAERGVFTNAGGGTPRSLDYVWISGLKFVAHTRDPADPNHSTQGAEGLQWLSGTRGVVIDDCVFQSYGTGITVIDHDGAGIRDVVVQRCLIVDSYAVGSHSQGIYVDGVTGFTLHGSVLDHNGWNGAVEGAEPTIYNHNVYVQSNCRDVVLTRNTILRGASHGVQLRPGGVCEENLFARNAISLLIGGGDEPVEGGVSAVASGNVILEGRDILESLPRGWGVDLATTKQVELHNTLIANVATANADARAVRADANTRHTNTVVRNWPGAPEFEWTTPFRDPGRSLASYRGAASFEGFAQALRARAGRDPGPYATSALLNWLRDGLRPEGP